MTTQEERERLRGLERDYVAAYQDALQGQPNRMPSIAHEVMVLLPDLLDAADERDELATKVDLLRTAVGTLPETLANLGHGQAATDLLRIFAPLAVTDTAAGDGL